MDLLLTFFFAVVAAIFEITTIFDGFFFLHRKGPSAVHCSSIKWRHREMLAVFSGCTEALPSYKDSVSFFEILRHLFFFAFFNMLAIILTIEINGG